MAALKILAGVLLLVATAIAVDAQTFITLVSFTQSTGSPGFLIPGVDGNLYTAAHGNLYKITPAGEMTTVYTFASGNPSSLFQVNDGSFYGYSGGEVFHLTSAGALTTVYTFSSSDDSPNQLIQAGDGDFYGTMMQGGSSTTASSFGNGTIFKISAAGTFTTLYNFDGFNGSQPGAGLLQATDGNLYGITEYGGPQDSCQSQPATNNGCGTIFQITPAGVVTTLHNFDATDGGKPAALTQGGDGNLYGITTYGGSGACVPILSYPGCGTVFRITLGGAFTKLHDFNIADGAYPDSLVAGSDGNLYGVAEEGGAGICQEPGVKGTFGCGTLFQITPAGSLTTESNFTPNADDSSPFAGHLIQGNGGIFYGLTSDGGTSEDGSLVAFSLASPDSPAIAASGGVLNGASFQPGISSGAWITINGTNLSPKTDTWNSSIVNGALPTTLDGVTLTVGGQPAYIEYVSATQINAIAPAVPSGSVPITVTNSNGTSLAATSQLSAETPAFFQWGNYAVATHQDYTYAVKNGTFAGLTTVPAKPGDVIILWGTGFGPTSPATPTGMETPSTAPYNTETPVTVTIGGKTAIVYGAALASGYAGLYQVAIQIPAGLSGDYPVVATINGVQSPSTTLITVQQ